MTSFFFAYLTTKRVDIGVFDEKLSECFIASISTTDDNRKLSFNKEVQRWLSKLSI